MLKLPQRAGLKALQVLIGTCMAPAAPSEEALRRSRDTVHCAMDCQGFRLRQLPGALPHRGHSRRQLSQANKAQGPSRPPQSRPRASACLHVPSGYAPSAQILLEKRPQSAAEDAQGPDKQAPDSHSWAAVAALLSRKHDRLDPTRALHLLPGQV